MAHPTARLCLLLALCSILGARTVSAEDRSYPTVARAEYVMACMATNGGTRDALQHCACAIDVIASLLPYDQYVEAETVMRMRQGPAGGDRMAPFRSAISNDMLRLFQDAQAEAEVRCF
jgi:hypothetical protein